MFINDLFNKKTIAEESPTLSRSQGVPTKQTPPPLNVPQGWEAKTQADGSTRISKIGSMSSADYKQNMANYKAQNWTPEKMADYSNRMASGQGYSDAEKYANYQAGVKATGRDDPETLAMLIPDENVRNQLQQQSQPQLNELSKDTLKSYVPKRIEKTKGLARTDYNKAQRIVKKDIPRAISKIKDPEYGEQGVAEARDSDTNFGSTVAHGSWVVYDGGKVKRFKTRDGAKAYAEKNGGKVASSEFYADNVQKQSVDEGSTQQDSKSWNRVMGDFDRVMTDIERSDPDVEKQHQQAVKKRIKTQRMSGPRGRLPEEQGNSYLDSRPSSVTAKQADEFGGAAKRAFKPEYYEPDTEPAPKRRDWDYSDPDIQPIVKDYLNKNVMDKKPMTYKQDVPEGSVQDKLHRRHQELRKKRGAPDPDYYKELRATYDLTDQERYAKAAELKKKYKVTNEDRERYLEEMRRAGYDIVTERATLCPECGGPAFEDRMLAEKQDACYHKVKSRYKVWPSAYASGALVRCRKKGASNWGNKSKK